MRTLLRSKERRKKGQWPLFEGMNVREKANTTHGQRDQRAELMVDTQDTLIYCKLNNVSHHERAQDRATKKHHFGGQNWTICDEEITNQTLPQGSMSLSTFLYIWLIKKIL